jgi:hypothetical protein
LLAAVALQSILGAVGALALLLALNLSFYRLLTRREGLLRAGVGVALHLVHHLVAVTAVPAGTLMYFLRRRRLSHAS